ncbi:MAG: SAM-dependent methyltransferase [Cyclobacteriaceae bacterium]|nr:SAM-dependent methyltransferase [Cyclobacteriaceae bacterium]MCH8514779.1 SAM-dependent methyltransferase [Cyclobacteriaceae bacterium]
MASTGILYLVPSSLAENTQDLVIPPQVVSILQHTQQLLVENERTARRFVSSLKAGISIPDLQLQVLDKKTPDQAIEKMMQPLLKGEDMAILSEAGCPGVADPGARAVATAHRMNIRVMPLVGPSSILLALMGSGFSGQQFAFHGYLPIEVKKRTAEIRRLEKTFLETGQTQIFMETPYRNDQMMTSLLKTLSPERLLCVACEITGENELIKTLPVKNWKQQLPKLHKLPTVFLIGG